MSNPATEMALAKRRKELERQMRIAEVSSDADARIMSTIGIQHGKLLGCPICGKNKWKTVLRGSAYQCRNCGYQREQNDPDSADLPE